MRRIARHIYHVGMIILFLLAAVAGFTQTRTFKGMLLTNILDRVNETVSGTVWVSSLDGNLITGLSLRDVELAVDGEELARIDEVRVSYDVVGFLFGSIRLSDVQILHPSVSLHRGTDGTWNLDRFLPPPTSVSPDSASRAPTITVRRVRVERARVRVVDSVALAGRSAEEDSVPSRVVDYANLEVSPLDLDAQLTSSWWGTRIVVASLAFDLPRHNLSVKNLSGAFELLENSTRITELDILTERSHLLLDASLARGIGAIESLRDLKGVSTRLVLKAQDIDLPELRQFLYPSLEFLDQSAWLDLRVSGTFDRLSVDRLMVRTPQSFVQLRGYISNLDRPDQLRLDIDGNESVARSDDIHALLPGLSVPSWERFGDVTFMFSFHGSPDDFDASVSAASRRGSVDASAHLNVGRLLSYKGTVRTTDFDLGGLLGDGTKISRLNASIDLDGSGTDIASMITVARAAIDSSRVGSVDVHRSVVIVDAAQGSYTGHVDVVSSAGSATVSGRMGLGASGTVEGFTANGTVRGLNLEPIVGSETYASDLSLSFSGSSEGSTSEGRDSVRLSFLESTFGSHTLSPSTVTVRQVRGNGSRTVSIESAPATVTITGTYELADVPAIGEYAAKVIVDHAVKTFSDLGTVRGPERPRGLSQPVGPATPMAFGTSDIHLVYELSSLEPVGALAGISLDGDASGMADLVGSPGDFQVSGRLSSGYFTFEDEAVSIAGKNTSVDFFADRSPTLNLRGHEGTALTLGVEALRVNQTILSSLELRTDIQDTVGMVSLGGIVDSLIHVTSIGTLHRSDRFVEFVFDHFGVEVGSYSLHAAESLAVVLGSDGVQFQHAQFRSGEEAISLVGILNPVGVSDLQIGMKDVQASHIPDVVSRTTVSGSLRGLSGVLNATMMFRGSFNHPNIQLDLAGRDIRLGGVSFSRVNATLGYFERLLTTDVAVNVEERADDGAPELLLRGFVPYDFSLAGEAAIEPLTGDIDLQMTSTGIDLRFFEPFLSSVTRQMQGKLTCNIRMRGDVTTPRYEGMATIRNGQFLFVPTRMVYRLDGNFLASEDRIELQNVVIRNTEADYGNGRMNVSGSLSLAGIALRGFDLGFNGELRVMREDSSRFIGNQYYGDLTVATSYPGLTWQGTVDRSKLTGLLLVRNAQITLPPDRESAQYSTRLIDIIRSSDSLSSRLRIAQRERDRKFSVTNDAPLQEEISFVDKIDFDLSIETQGPTRIRFIFNSQANDVLFADLRGRLSFLRDPSETRLIGDIEVTDRSFYNFLKRFSASGRMLFTGDPLNPELDIVAQYEGIHKKTVAGGVDGGSTQTVDERTRVILYLQGPRSELRTSFRVEVEDPSSTSGYVEKTPRGDVEADAIAFIMTGQFRDELTEQQRTGLLSENLGYGLASGLLTGPLSETLRRTTKGSIQSLDVIYYGGGQFTSGADVRVTGQFGDAVYKVGGRVLDSFDNTNVIVEIPMSALLNSNELRNLVLTFERRVEGIDTIEDQRRASNEARIQYRFKF